MSQHRLRRKVSTTLLTINNNNLENYIKVTVQQQNALEFNPNQLELTRVSSLSRDIAAPLVRVWENVLDWEHLPHLHNTSFDYVALDVAADWGWRTWADAARSGHIELVIDRQQSRYVARSYKADHQISEIWTTLTPEADITHIEVEFWAPDVDPNRKDALGAAYLSLYEVLWDEDEMMMSERHRRLTEHRDRRRELSLGPRAELNLPLTVEMMGNVFKVEEFDGQLRADPAICPHLLGPLSRDDDGMLTCPWHGYQFNPDTGQCISPVTANCKLPRRPEVLDEGGLIFLRDSADRDRTGHNTG